MKRFHPISIITGMPKFSYLVLVPITEKVVGGEIRTVERQWVAALGLILFFSIIQHLSQGWKIEKSLLHYNRGILRRCEQTFYLENFSCIDISDTPFLRLFGAKKISVSMMGKNKNFFAGIFSRRQTAEIVESLDLQRLRLTHKSSVPRVLLSSFFGSNASSGLLIGAPIVYRTGRYAGERLQEQVLNRFDEAQAFFARFLPPFFALAALLMLAGWLFGVIHSALRYAGAELLQNEKFIVVRGGIWKRSVCIFSRQNIQGLLLRETPLMRAGGFRRLCAVSAAEGKTFGELPVLLPLVKREELLLRSEKLCRISEKEQYRVFLNLFYRYCALTLTAAVALYFYPAYKKEIFMMMAVLFIILVFLYGGKKLQIKTGGAGENSVCYVRGVTRLTLLSCSASHIEKRETQSYYQSRGGVCKKGIYLTAGKRVKLNCIVECKPS